MAMRLELDMSLAEGYKSPSQRARRLTEGWFEHNMYCPACPNDRLPRHSPNGTTPGRILLDATCCI